MVTRQESKPSRPQQVKAKSTTSLSLTRQAICSYKTIILAPNTKMGVFQIVQLPILRLLLSLVTLLLALGRLVDAKDVLFKPEDDPCHPQLPPCLPSGQLTKIEKYEGEFAEIKCLVYGRSSNQIKKFVKFGRANVLPPIAVGREVFLDRDKRYSVVHQNGSALWTFAIDFLRQSDSGRYECNDGGKAIFYKLVVLPLSPATRFSAYEDGKNMYIDIPNFVREGSSFQVSCYSKVGTGQDTVFLDWYKNGRVVSTSSEKGIKIAKGWYDTNGGELRVTMKFLYALPHLSGVYECRRIKEERYSDVVSIKAEVRVRQRRRDYINGRRARVLPPPNRIHEIVFTSSPNEVYKIPKKGEYHVTQNDSPGGRNVKRENKNGNSASSHHPSEDLMFTLMLGVILVRV